MSVTEVLLIITFLTKRYTTRQDLHILLKFVILFSRIWSAQVLPAALACKLVFASYAFSAISVT